MRGLDVLFPVRRRKRCVDYQNGFGTVPRGPEGVLETARSASSCKSCAESRFMATRRVDTKRNWLRDLLL